MKVLLINSDDGPDYLADLVNYYFLTNNYDLFTNHSLDFLFNDYEYKNKLYGKGFTLYGKVNESLKSKQKLETLDNLYSSINEFDLVVFTSIHRNFKSKPLKKIFIDINKISKNQNIITLDGEDFTQIDEFSAKNSNYFKRELIKEYENLANPISFTFPDEEIIQKFNLDSKTQILSPMDPRFKNSYIYVSEAEYFEQYQRSIFGVTTKKAGWDCMRHYEILSTGTLLFFPTIEDKPTLTMSTFPTDLQIEINKLFLKLISNSENFDSLEKIRLDYPSKNYISRSVKKTKRNLSKVGLTENNFLKLEEYGTYFYDWLKKYGTSSSYKNIFKL